MNSRSMRRIEMGAVMLAVGLLTACGESDPKASSEKAYTRAVEHNAKGEFRAAVIELKNALKDNPENGAAHQLLGSIELAAGDSWDAEQESRAALKAGVPRATVFRQLARALLNQDKTQELRTLLDAKDPKSNPPPTEVDAFRGLMLLRQNEATEGESLLQNVASNDPGNLDALVGLAGVAEQRQDLDAAVKWMEKAEAVAPTDNDVLMAAASLAMAQNRPNEAEATLRHLVSQMPLNPFHQLVLAQTLIAEGKDAEAESILKEVLTKIPKSAWANHLQAVLDLRAGRFQEADARETAALASQPSLVPAQIVDGIAKYNLKQFEQAARLLGGNDPAIAKNDQAALVRAAALLQLGRAAEGYGLIRPLIPDLTNNAEGLGLSAAVAAAASDFPRAKDLYLQAIALKPDSASLHLGLGKVELALHEVDGGLKELAEARRLSPHDDDVLMILFSSTLEAKRYDEAEALAEEIQKERPHKAAGWTMAGFVAMAQQHIDDAITAFTKGLDVEPESIEAASNLASIYVTKGDTDKARAFVAQLYSAHPSERRVIELGIATENRAGDLGQLKIWLQRMVGLDPGADAQRADLARLWLKEGNAEKAIATASAGLVSGKSQPALLAILGQSYMAANRYGDAAPTLAALVDMAPSAQNYRLLAQAYQNLGNNPRAEQALGHLLELSPDDADARYQLAVLLGNDRRSDTARVEGLANSLAKDLPGDPRTVEVQALLETRKNGPQAAIPLLERYLASHKDKEPRPLVLMLSACDWAVGRQDASIQTFNTWLGANPDDHDVRLTLATRLIAAKRYAEARDALLVVFKAQPNNWVAENNLAWVYLDLGDVKEAKAHIENARKLQPSDPGVLDTAGQIALKSGDTADAVALLKLAVAAPHPTPAHRLHLAQAMEASGDKDGARATAKQLLAEQPKSPEAEDARALLHRLGG